MMGSAVRSYSRYLAAFMFALVVLQPGDSSAGGLQTLEQGTWDMGRALVGSPSAADSAATAFYNPAGMTRLESPQLVMGGMQIFGDMRFDSDPATTFSGGNGGQIAEDAVVPSGPFYVHPLSDRWAVGFSLTAPFMGTLDYAQDWVGRYVITSLDFAVYSLQPAIAYEIDDKLSLGFSLPINYTTFDQKLALNTPAPFADGRVHIDDAHDWQMGWSASLLFEPWEGTRLGVVYRSEIEPNLRGDIKINAPGIPGFTFSLETKLPLPQNLFVSLRQEITEDLVLFVDWGWADFSSFDVTQIDLSTPGGPTALSLPRNWRDTVAYGIAAEYKLAPAWTLQGGISYASSPVRNANRTPDLPLDRQVRYGAGVIYQWREDVRVGLSYEYLDLGDAKIGKTLAGGFLKGEYDDNKAQFIAISVAKSF
jgi:long-chain fatty acid transport protein